MTANTWGGKRPGAGRPPRRKPPSKTKWEGTTTVREITRDRRCGWCGDDHPDSLACPLETT